MTQRGAVYARPLADDGAPVGDWTLVSETDGALTFERERIYQTSIDYTIGFTLEGVDGYRVEDLLMGREPTPIFYGVVADLGDPRRRGRVRV